MKIFLSFGIFLLCLLGIILGQDYFQVAEISAVPSKEKSKVIGHYESLYKSLKFKTYDNNFSSPAEEKTKVAIVNFWAAWCQPCLEEFESMKQLREKFQGKGLAIYGINTDEQDQIKKIKKIKDEYKLNFKIIADKNSYWVDKFKVNSIPFSVIYINGEVFKYHLGGMDFVNKELLAKFESILKPKKE